MATKKSIKQLSLDAKLDHLINLQREANKLQQETNQLLKALIQGLAEDAKNQPFPVAVPVYPQPLMEPAPLHSPFSPRPIDNPLTPHLQRPDVQAYGAPSPLTYVSPTLVHDMNPHDPKK